ncbi:hypothetical protein SMALB_4579 [Streptomyces malaysiensis]|uniref:Uncharacterized protein n=1 Tax=Streptomyces malaysiensis TaxID=92644 RepID=A0A7X5X4L5_STRMQ|nr:hypothetical protein [Streptomyces malaysiensis]
MLPLALSGTNTAVGAVSAAALVGGAPVAAAVAVGGAAVLGVSAAVGNRRRAAGDRRKTAPDRHGGRTRRERTSTPSRASGSGLTGGRGRGHGRGKSLASRTGGGTSGKRHGSTGAGRHGRYAPGGTTASRLGTGRDGPSRGSAGRLGQIRALRASNQAQTPNRSAARHQTAAARRAVADARRDARAAGRAAKALGQGRARRALGWTAGKAASGIRVLVNKARTARDQAAGQQVAAKRAQVRKAPARRRARWGLLKSAARFQGRRLLAALAGGTVGLLGCLTTPLGRKLGWRWLMHPGRRLYRRLMLSAREARAARDEQIRLRQAAEEAEADAAAQQDPNEIGDRVERPTHLIPTHAGQEAIHVSGFKFEEAAADMENAARSYDPDGNMEVLAMIEGLPQAMQSIANTFRILAERSDEEFAFEKDVAAGFDDIHRTLLNAVDASDTLVPLFRSVHEQDIARHEDPRNGTQAEKGWNV